MNKKILKVAGVAGMALFSFGAYIGGTAIADLINKPRPVLTAPTGAYGTRAIAAADMNKDGLVDILAADCLGDVYIHFKQKDGNYLKEEKPIFRIPTGAFGTRGFGAADDNGDGLMDLFVTDVDGKTRIYYNLGNNKFEE